MNDRERKIPREKTANGMMDIDGVKALWRTKVINFVRGLRAFKDNLKTLSCLPIVRPQVNQNRVSGILVAAPFPFQALWQLRG